MSPSSWIWVAVVLNVVVQASCSIIALRRMRRLDRAHRARIQAAWDYELANLRKVNLEAAALAKDVHAQAHRFRETFGIEELPADGVPKAFRARRPQGWN